MIIVRLRVVPVTPEEAYALINGTHRHHRAPRGYKFVIGAARGSDLVGALVAGRPVSRILDDRRTLEVTRCAVVDGAQNACSFLYAAARRVTFALGYDRLITYTRRDESGASLRGAGWTVVAQRPARAGWDRPSRRRSADGSEWTERTLWQTGT